MNGILLKNKADAIGLIVLDEARKLQSVAYLSDEKNLEVIFTNGDTEKLLSTIEAQFEPALLSAREVFIAHFPHDGFDKNPTDEYHVPLEF
jgi:hypothetical protein